MGVYTRRDSQYFWLWLGRHDGAKLQERTRVRVDAPTPRHRRENRQLAEEIYHKRMTELAREDHGLAGRKTQIGFSAYADWYQEHVSIHKRGHTREVEILKVLRAAFGASHLAAITKERVIEWRTARRETVAPATVNRELDVLKHMLVTAVPQYLTRSPIVGLTRLRVPKSEPKLLSRPDEAKLLEQLGPADRALIIMALDTLMRLSDIVNLKRAQDHRGYITVVDPKVTQYRVPVSKRLRRALDQLPKNGPYFFSHHRGAKNQRDYRSSVRKMLQQACDDASVDYGRGAGITFHALRHTGATRMLEAGVDLRTVQEIGGWSSMRQLTRYTHPTEQTKRRAVEAVGGRADDAPVA